VVGGSSAALGVSSTPRGNIVSLTKSELVSLLAASICE
jgi:hypothetical protein